VANGAGEGANARPERGRRLAAGAAETPKSHAGGGPSLAVMPFQNLSADPENEYFSDGLAEEILNALSEVAGLTVAARSSSFWFKNKPAAVSEIAIKLHVKNLLQGSVRRAGSHLRVTVQMVDAQSGFQLWSERYDRQMEDVFEIQDEIARAIAGKLKVTLGAAAKPATTNTEAYEMYLKGRHFWHLRTPNALRSAIECFRETIKMDPAFVLAYAGLADCYGILRFYGWTRAEETREEAYAAVAEAVRLEPERWEVIYSRGGYKFFFERDWRAAEAAIGRRARRRSAGRRVSRGRAARRADADREQRARHRRSAAVARSRPCWRRDGAASRARSDWRSGRRHRRDGPVPARPARSAAAAARRPAEKPQRKAGDIERPAARLAAVARPSPHRGAPAHPPAAAAAARAADCGIAAAPHCR